MVKKILSKQKPLKKAPIQRNFIGIDFENSPNTGAFINAGLFGERGDHHGKTHHVEKVYHSQKDLFEWLLSVKQVTDTRHPFTLVFFNLSYDYPFLQEISDDSKLLVAGGRFISGELKNGIKLIDISNQASDGSLEDWIGYLDMKKTRGVKKEALPVPGKSLFSKENLKILDIRVASDAKATWILTEYIQKFYLEFLKIPLTLTIGSGARRFFTQYYFSDFWKRDNKYIDAMERESYRGGRVETIQRGKHKVWSYDVNSMYLSVMRDELLPDPNSCKAFKAPKELAHDKMYITKCKVYVPYQHIPPLPLFRDKLIFPYGTFSGVWCSPELEYAIKECGVKILKIEWVLTYNGKPYTKNFANFIWDMRKKFPKSVNKGMNLLIKKIGNSFYGGLGQRNTLFSFAGKVSDFENIELPKDCTPILTEINGIKYITVSGNEKEDSSHTFTCIPSFITSYARLKLLKKAKEHPRAVVYGDTDSLKFNKNLHSRYEKELGGWGFEKDKSGNWYFHKPKMYGKHRRGMPEKMKGVPKKNVEIVQETKSFIRFKILKPTRYREGIKYGNVINRWGEGFKTVYKDDDKRVWKRHSKRSKPICIMEE